LGAGTTANGFFIGHLGRFEHHLRAIFAFQFFDGDFNMLLAHARQNEIAGLFVAVQVDSLVFLLHAMQSLRQLVLVRFALGFQGEGNIGREMDRPVELDRRLFIAQGVAGGDVSKLGDGDDFPRQRFFHRLLLLAFQAK
jgi:hypothetical protein